MSRIKKLEREVEKLRIETDALKEKEAMLSGFFEGSEDAICIRDCERRLVLWNQAFARSVKANCGVDIQFGMQAEDFIPQEIFNEFNQQRNQLYQAMQGEPQSAEFAYPCQDGTTRYFNVSWFPVRMDDEIFGVAEISRDVTDIKSYESDLRKHEEMLRGFMENSNETIWSFEVTPPMSMHLSIDDQVDYLYDNARVVLANTAWAKQSGYDNWQDMIGLRLDEIVPRSEPKNVAVIKELAVSKYNLNNFITHDLNSQGERRIVRNNHCAEIRDDCLIRTWGTHLDGTEEETSKQQLLEAEKRYRMVADFTFDWEYWEGPDGKLIYVSPSCKRITGYTPQEFMEKPGLIQDIIKQEERDAWHGHRALEDQRLESRRISFRIKKKDGTIRWIEHACLPVYG
ncbi:MAG: PAS domain S-box protein, partial [Deltaproteobacteria bacterium]|nr:PAS domain S-box protein [Deltaproteobacteria bacterium]